jgi:monofunctional glycosyltransferase
VIAAVLLFSYIGYIYLTLPDVRRLAKENPRTTAFMQLRIDEARANDRKFSIRHQWVSYSRISPMLKRAVIVTEDAAFFDHDGIDLEEIRASLEKNWEEGQFLRGASTITQQLAKNLYLWPGRSFVRKGLEAYFTIWLEQTWPKRRILEVYLNVAEFGPGIFGATAASEVVFGKAPSALTLSDAALLAAVLPNPKRMSASKPSAYVSERAGQIEQVALHLGVPFIAGI